MADFLTRLAGRTLGLVPTVQPVLAPMYAPQQQFPGAEDSQQGIPPPPDRVNHVPAPGVVTEYPLQAMQGQEQSLQDRPPDELSANGLVERADYSQKTPSPLVPQGDQLSISPMYVPTQATHRPDRVRNVPATSDRLSSVEIEGAEPAPDLVPVFRPASLEGSSSTRSALSQEQSTAGDQNGGSSQ